LCAKDILNGFWVILGCWVRKWHPFLWIISRFWNIDVLYFD